jgi:hypothetical protein
MANQDIKKLSRWQFYALVKWPNNGRGCRMQKSAILTLYRRFSLFLLQNMGIFQCHTSGVRLICRGDTPEDMG